MKNNNAIAATTCPIKSISSVLISQEAAIPKAIPISLAKRCVVFAVPRWQWWDSFTNITKNSGITKPSPNPINTEDIPIVPSVPNKEKARVSNPNPMTTNRKVFSFRKNRRANNKDIINPAPVPAKNGKEIPTFLNMESFKKGCANEINKPGTKVIRIRLITGTHPRSNKNRSNEYNFVTMGARNGTYTPAVTKIPTIPIITDTVSKLIKE